jgi:hypothetical protein
MSQRLPAIGLALLLIGLVALVISGTFGEVVVVPLLFLWWAAQVLYASIPQALLWGVFVVIAVLLVAKNFPASRAPLPLAAPQAVAQGRVADWSRWLHDSRRDDHSRWRLAQRLSQLAIETLAFREQCPPHEISRRLEHGTLDIPPQLRAYLRAGSMPYWPAPKLRRRFGRPAQDTAHVDPLATDPQLVIDYLEDTVQHTIGAAA